MNINKNFLKTAVELFNLDFGNDEYYKSSNTLKIMNDFTEKQLEVLLENKNKLFTIFEEDSTGLNSMLRHIFSNPYCNKYSNEFMEKDLQKQIIDNWQEYFPEYDFVDNEVTIPQGRIDILAKDKKSNRDVIIELKYPSGKLNRQLFDYMENYKKPILVGVNSADRNKSKRIIYKDINVKRKLDKCNIEYIDKEKYDIYNKLSKTFNYINLISCKNCIYRYFLNNMNIRTQIYNMALNDYFSKELNKEMIENIISEHSNWASLWYKNDLDCNNYYDLKKFNKINVFDFCKIIAKQYCLSKEIIFYELKEDTCYHQFDNNKELNEWFEYEYINTSSMTVFDNLIENDLKNVDIWGGIEEGYSCIKEEIEDYIRTDDADLLKEALSVKFVYKKVIYTIKPDDYDIDKMIKGEMNYEEYLPVILINLLKEDKYSKSYITKMALGRNLK